MPESHSYIEGIRMNKIECEASDSPATDYERLVAEIESLALSLRPLLPDIKTHWPEFNSICAELRGFAFKSFSMSRYFDPEPPRLHKPQPQRSTVNVTLDDLGL